eukprot:232441-Amorphochlora_amoeboformis.AAC.1
MSNMNVASQPYGGQEGYYNQGYPAQQGGYPSAQQGGYPAQGQQGGAQVGAQQGGLGQGYGGQGMQETSQVPSA